MPYETLKTKHVLIFDDEPSILEALKIVLETRGFTVTTINDSVNAEKILQDTDPDIVFVDLWMPGLDGKAVTEVVKRNPKTKNTPVVIISAHTDIDRRAREAGADDYLEKPFNISDFLNKIEHWTAKAVR